jgi:hypothetical protein
VTTPHTAGDDDAIKSGNGASSFTRSELNAIGRFLVSRRRALWKGAGAAAAPGRGGTGAAGREVAALQAALHEADLEAAEYVAREVAANPPKSLMAIILPRHVGGWHGGRRRQPGEQGGGAPCPEEFLHNRDKRTAATEGASRHHPQAAASSQPADSQDASATTSTGEAKDAE